DLSTASFSAVAIGTNAAPIVAMAAAAAPNPAGGTTTSLSVLGSDDTGETNLSYTWRVTAAPVGAAPPTFTANGTNAAKNTTLTFSRAGNYSFLVTIADPGGLTATSGVAVTVAKATPTIMWRSEERRVGQDCTQRLTATA